MGKSDKQIREALSRIEAKCDIILARTERRKSRESAEIRRNLDKLHATARRIRRRCRDEERIMSILFRQ